jgi:hypothetical protein
MKVLTTFKLTITYEASALGFETLSTSTLYNGATCNLEGCTGFDGVISALVNGISSSTSQAEVTGANVELMSLAFTVLDTPGVFPQAITLLVDDFVNVGTLTYEQNLVGQMNGDSDGPAYAAPLTVLSPVVVGAMAYVQEAELFNTAYLSGEPVTTR